MYQWNFTIADFYLSGLYIKKRYNSNKLLRNMEL